MADPTSTTVPAKQLAAASNTTLSAPLRWLARIVAEVTPWLALLGAVAALASIGTKHLSAFLTEAQAWSAANIESRGAPVGARASSPTDENRNAA
jgi:hypothetical protein